MRSNLPVSAIAAIAAYIFFKLSSLRLADRLLRH
jgi:hypothetical protein